MALILIVDGQKSDRQIYAQIATQIEETVIVELAQNADSALDWLENNIPDLIVVNFNLPDMAGDEFIALVRKDRDLQDVPVIVITRFEDRNLRLRALDAGATDLLISPVDHREFVARARNLLKMSRQSRMLTNRADALLESLKKSESILAWTQREDTSRLFKVINTLPVMVSATDLDGCFLFLNVCKANYFNLTPAQMIGKPRADFVSPERSERHQAIDRMVISSKHELRSFEEEIRGADGIVRVFNTTKSCLIEDGEIIGVVTASQDIDDRKAAETHLQHLANHDPLTGLANRAFLRDQVEREIGRCRRGDSRFALHVVDLDGFKQVNDNLGHTAGDQLLVRVAEALQSVAGMDDVVARLGGDEFAILQTGVTNNLQIETMAKAIIAAIPDVNKGFDGKANVTASLGIATHPEDGINCEQLIRKADSAMYSSKAAKGNGFSFFEINAQARKAEENRLDASLGEALRHNRFELLYQRVVDLRSEKIVGCEALLRMRDQTGLRHKPREFLARAESNGLIIPINEWVIRQACWQGVSWLKEGWDDFTIAVNLSPVQFLRQSVPLLVARILNETKLPPHFLELELTENIVLNDADRVGLQVRQLKELGVKISIDDFGTSGIDMSYITRYPVDRLKIDQAFIKNLLTNPMDANIVRSAINMAHSVECDIIAKGVETDEVAAQLRADHCDFAQGHYFGHPQTAEALAAVMDKHIGLEAEVANSSS